MNHILWINFGRHKMLLYNTVLMAFVVIIVDAVHFPSNLNSDVSDDDKSSFKDHNKTGDQSEQDLSSHEIEMDKSNEKTKDKKFLDDALETILDPNSVIGKVTDTVDNFIMRIKELENSNATIESFMDELDNISIEVCKKSQEALWSYVTDINNPVKKNYMIQIASEEDEIKKQYWNLLKHKYLNQRTNYDKTLTLPQIKRKIRIIKERGNNVQMPQTKQREEIDSMQRIWSRAIVCAYNVTICDERTAKSMSDIMAVFKTSNDSKELAYYWKGYRDVTGKKVRPIFKDYVIRMNSVAKSENFTDAGEMWRYMYEDDDFVGTVDRIWAELKPLYMDLHEYVRTKLKAVYKKDFEYKDAVIPAHILGNLWAQDWQAIYPLVAPYPQFERPKLIESNRVTSIHVFDSVDQFYVSLGFGSSKESYESTSDSTVTGNCLPSSHDMCDGVNYKIKWCGEKVADIAVGLLRAARLLGHVQYFKSYSALPLLFRDGPTPAFHEALSDVVAIQLITPEHLKSLNLVDMETGPEVTMNHLVWLALEKIPLMAYGYVLDKWRWDIFSNIGVEKWNQYWWDLRVNETGVCPPVPRSEEDLDPASKYHVVSHVQYITYLISHVIEFQVLLSMCNAANHTGPLHLCSVYGVPEAGNILRRGMSMGSSEDWRAVLQAMTGETKLSTSGILEYFSPLREFLKSENVKTTTTKRVIDIDSNPPIIVGAVVITLIACIILLYFAKKYNIGGKALSLCGLSKNGSLDIVTNEMSTAKSNEIEGIVEDKL